MDDALHYEQRFLAHLSLNYFPFCVNEFAGPLIP